MSYGRTEAVRGISFEVARGEIFAFLGPNGAGKTTTVEILEGYRERTGGSVEVLGFDPQQRSRQFRDQIGIVLQDHGLPVEYKVRELLARHHGYYSNPRDIDEVLSLVDLSPKRNDLIKTLSGGERRRLDLAVALVGNPELIFLDEPTTGFDPAARRNSWEVIRRLCDLGRTVFLTTHYMDEAQELANRIAIIANGEIIAEGLPETLGGSAAEIAEIRFSLDPAPSPAGLPDLGAADVEITPDGVTIRSADVTKTLNVITTWALRKQIELRRLQVLRPRLEDIYLDIVGMPEDERPPLASDVAPPEPGRQAPAAARSGAGTP